MLPSLPSLSQIVHIEAEASQTSHDYYDMNALLSKQTDHPLRSLDHLSKHELIIDDWTEQNNLQSIHQTTLSALKISLVHASAVKNDQKKYISKIHEFFTTLGSKSLVADHNFVTNTSLSELALYRSTHTREQMTTNDKWHKRISERVHGIAYHYKCRLFKKFLNMHRKKRHDLTFSSDELRLMNRPKTRRHRQHLDALVR